MPETMRPSRQPDRSSIEPASLLLPTCILPSMRDHNSSLVTPPPGHDYHTIRLDLEVDAHRDVWDFCSREGVTVTNLLQASWAIVVANYAGVEDVSFLDFDRTGRNELNDLAATLICHSHVTNKGTIRDVLDSVKSYSVITQGTDQPNCGLEVVELDFDDRRVASGAYTGINLLAQVVVLDDSVRLRLHAHETWISEDNAIAIAHTFMQTVTSFAACEGASSTLCQDLRVCSPHDQVKMSQLNGTRPLEVEATFMDLFDEAVRKYPASQATFASDGSGYRYRQLSIVVDKLATLLIGTGLVSPEIPIPICFDKSAMAIVAMLAIFRAGGAFVVLDPTYPNSRIDTILDTVNATIVLVQPEHLHLFQRLTSTQMRVIEMNEEKVNNLPDRTVPLLCQAEPSNAAYIHFTSGSTGVPKAMLIEHRTLCTAISVLATPLGISSTSRVLQFAAYTFDGSFGDIFVTLAKGACMCIPSEYERINDLVGVINRTKVDTACLIPSVACLLRPEDVPGLQTLSLGGEALVLNNLQRWGHRTTLNSVYGPSECTIWCTAQTNMTTESQANNIGRGLGVRLWITNASNHDQLTPLGCVGELLIEGPMLARGYLDLEQTRKAFIVDPAWVPEDEPSSRRFYKTGDLARFNHDGTLNFIGRKDSQVKVHGRRIELGEIEYHLATHERISQSMVMVPKNGRYHDRLVAIVALRQDDDDSRVEEETDKPRELTMIASALTPDTAGVKEMLSTKLPSYMVPQTWMVVKNIPLLTSAKMNRTLVKRHIESLTQISIEQGPCDGDAMHGQAKSRGLDLELQTDAKNDIEKRLLRLWYRALQILGEVALQPMLFGVDRTFEEMGGDSLSAMELVSKCRMNGFQITVEDLFTGNCKTVREMAIVVRKSGSWLASETDTAVIWKMRPSWWRSVKLYCN